MAVLARPQALARPSARGFAPPPHNLSECRGGSARHAVPVATRQSRLALHLTCGRRKAHSRGHLCKAQRADRNTSPEEARDSPGTSGEDSAIAELISAAGRVPAGLSDDELARLLRRLEQAIRSEGPSLRPDAAPQDFAPYAGAADPPPNGSAPQDAPLNGSAPQDAPLNGSGPRDTLQSGSISRDTPANGSAGQRSRMLGGPPTDTGRSAGGTAGADPAAPPGLPLPSLLDVVRESAAARGPGMQNFRSAGVAWQTRKAVKAARGVWRKGTYLVDRALLASVYYQYIVLVAVTAVSVLALCYCYYNISGDDFQDSLWTSLQFVLDSGMFGEEAGAARRAVALALTLVGLFFVSTLIGIVDRTIQDALEGLTLGVKRVAEDNHTIILQWNERGPILVESLCKGYKSVDPAGFARAWAVVVVVADQPRSQVVADLQARLPNALLQKVLVMEGDPSYRPNLDLVGIDDCRTVVVLSEEHSGARSDAAVLRVLLAVQEYAERRREASATLAEVLQADTAAVVASRFPNTQALLLGDLGVRLSVQALVEPALCAVYHEFLRTSYEGNEFYLKEVPEVTGQPYSACFDALEAGIPVAVYRRSEDVVDVMPRDSYVMRAGDELCVLAREYSDVRLDARRAAAGAGYQQCASDDTCFVLPEDVDDVAVDVAVEAEKEEPEQSYIASFVRGLVHGERQHEEGDGESDGDGVLVDPFGNVRQRVRGVYLLCGWRQGLSGLLMEMDRRLGFGSKVYILSTVPRLERNALLESEGMDFDALRNLRIEHLEGSPYVRRDLELLLPHERFTAVLYMTDLPFRDASIDGEVLMGTVFLRDVLEQRGAAGAQAVVLNEMVGDMRLARTGVKYIRMGNLHVAALAQSSMQPTLLRVFSEIFNSDEVQVVLTPAKQLTGQSTRVESFQTLQARVRAQGATLLGYINGSGSVVLNPTNKDKVREWMRNEELVVMYRTDAYVAHKS